MDIAEVLRDILVVLVFAKLAAEVAERVGVPAVVGEILAGILVGPSLFGLVSGGDEVLRTLGEIGVILLLLDVGMEMDLAELGKVGRTSFLVATVGVVAPMVLGIGAMEALGFEFKTSLFVGAALTATSVGITARVFGDLRALATTEARIVLGAAVADDVMGLVVLTVVVRLVTEGSVSVLSVAGIIGVAVAFLLVGGIAGLRAAPPLFGLVERFSRSTGTLVAIALAFTLGFAQLAEAARLAPIVGAFVAGIALSRSQQSERIRAELAPVGHLFIPVFFLQIGIDAEVRAFFSATVLRDAAILLAVAIVGKLLSPIGAIGSPGDKPLIGLGMLPRGEVGLIFATLGLQAGVLDENLYAALLLVVLLTTLLAPQLLKLRYAKIRASGARAAAHVASPEPPPGGWLVVEDGEVHLRVDPPDTALPSIALQAAVLVGRFRPGDDLLDRLSGAPQGAVDWEGPMLGQFLDVIERGNARSWRFLETTGALDRLLPELADAFRRRQRDAYSIDPVGVHRVRAMERLRVLDADDPLAHEIRSLQDVDVLLLGALFASSFDEELDPVGTARRAVRRLGLEAAREAAVLALVADRDLLWSAAKRSGGLGVDAVTQLASHLESPERARALYASSALDAEGRERWELGRLRELHDLVQAVFADPALGGADANAVLERQQAEAVELVTSPTAEHRVRTAPRAYQLRETPATVARHASFLDPLPPARTARVQVEELGPESFAVDVAARDTPGLLAAVTGALRDATVEVRSALLARWEDGGTIVSFTVTAPTRPRLGDVAATIEESLARGRLSSGPIDGVEVRFDRHASPWHTVCEVTAPDRPGLLHDLAVAFAAAGVEVVAATIGSDERGVLDRFELVDGDGAKLDAARQAQVEQYLRDGVEARRRRFGRAFAVRSA